VPDAPILEFSDEQVIDVLELVGGENLGELYIRDVSEGLCDLIGVIFRVGGLDEPEVVHLFGFRQQALGAIF